MRETRCDHEKMRKNQMPHPAQLTVNLLVSGGAHTMLGGMAGNNAMCQFFYTWEDKGERPGGSKRDRAVLTWFLHRRGRVEDPEIRSFREGVGWSADLCLRHMLPSRRTTQAIMSDRCSC